MRNRTARWRSRGSAWHRRRSATPSRCDRRLFVWRQRRRLSRGRPQWPGRPGRATAPARRHHATLPAGAHRGRRGICLQTTCRCGDLWLTKHGAGGVGAGAITQRWRDRDSAVSPMEAVNIGWLWELVVSVHVSQIVPGPVRTMWPHDGSSVADAIARARPCCPAEESACSR